jgi:hypothetical protein
VKIRRIGENPRRINSFGLSRLWIVDKNVTDFEAGVIGRPMNNHRQGDDFGFNIR